MHKTIIITLLAALALSVSVTAQPWAPFTPASLLISAGKAGEGKYAF